MKKHVIAATTLSTLLLAMANAQAATPTAELKVIGELTVPACTVAAADDGVYDFGRLSATMVKPAATTALTPMTKTWTITCDAETYLNFAPVDNRAASVSTVATTNFGMGMVNGTGKIGYYTAQMANATVDGVASELFTSASSTFTPAATADITTGLRSGWATPTANTQKSGKVFVSDIIVSPVLASSATMNGAITDDTNLDGSMTLSFAYGI
ncbi:beta-fimbriae major subunit [Chania multitudinisentens RB-25]|uniref:Beta-fimbriae major subunit n=1 Tax=Chania multitudinisentens RB-25 TaxID=1441930 RepID=W0L4F4_9GAMM|nr:DUF1120 domain-containing protein [Chania multitudinisentens]AHG18586.1 beta-fimbriae major subunit [Chania multitudinisentens RB-25]